METTKPSLFYCSTRRASPEQSRRAGIPFEGKEPHPQKKFQPRGIPNLPLIRQHSQSPKHSKHNSRSMLLETSMDAGDNNILLGNPQAFSKRFQAQCQSPESGILCGSPGGGGIMRKPGRVGNAPPFAPRPTAWAGGQWCVLPRTKPPAGLRLLLCWWQRHARSKAPEP